MSCWITHTKHFIMKFHTFTITVELRLVQEAIFFLFFFFTQTQTVTSYPCKIWWVLMLNSTPCLTTVILLQFYPCKTQFNPAASLIITHIFFSSTDLNLEITSSRNMMITGATGSGKTSILRVLHGLWPSAAGTVEKICNSTTQRCHVSATETFLVWRDIERTGMHETKEVI